MTNIYLLCATLFASPLLIYTIHKGKFALHSAKLDVAYFITGLVLFMTILEPVDQVYLLLYLSFIQTLFYVLKLRPTSFVLTVVISSLILFVAVIKNYFGVFYNGSISPTGFIGASYIMIRAIDMALWLKRNPTAEKQNIISNINYLAGPLVMLAGPIQRYDQHISQSLKKVSTLLTQEKFLSSMHRSFKGLFLLLIVAPQFLLGHKYLLEAFNRLPVGVDIAPVYLACTATSYFLFIYWNFSGYTHLVIGLGSFFGLGLPENFNKPLKSRSFIEFWSRWHMSLSSWFNDNIFAPVGKWSLHKTKGKAPIATFAFVSFLVFMLLGVWHGGTKAFIATSILFGLGGLINSLYKEILPKLISKRKTKKLNKNFLYSQICSAAALSYITLSIFAFWISWEAATSIISNFSGLHITWLFLSCGLILLLFKAFIEAATRTATAIGLIAQSDRKNSIRQVVEIATLAYFTLLGALEFTSLSEVVYGGF